MMLQTRFALALFTLLAFGACTSATNPRVKVAANTLTQDERDHLRDRSLAKALQQAALAAQRLPTAREAYNSAIASFVVDLQKRAPIKDWAKPIRVEQPGQDWEISFDALPLASQGRPAWSPSSFDQIIPANLIKASGYDQQVTGTGIGFPVVMALENIERLNQQRGYRPGNGVYVPGSVLLEFGRARSQQDPIPVRLRILNPLQQRQVRYAQATRPLQFDISAAVELSLNNPYIKKSAGRGLLRPDKHIEDLGLFAIEQHTPTKIPVIFVHGLRSDAHIWKNAVNEIYADPTLNARYQPVLFLYPTGLSVPASAAKLRQSLIRFRQTWDPNGTDPGMNNMVIVGHSMGGILSRMQVIDSGSDFRKAFFTRPIAQVPWLSDALAKEVESALVFDHQPYIKRAVFIAVPHRGSHIADWRLVRLAIRLIKLPTELIGLATQAITEDMSALNPALLSYNLLGMRSVDMLSPDHPYFNALENRPILVPYHSIIGDRGRGDSPASSDGVVPYHSSHLQGAQSEFITPFPHSCTTQTQTSAELMRILRLHIGQRQSTRPSPPSSP
jgi:pimeloyl-ACP methyl ester carboxylesterase